MEILLIFIVVTCYVFMQAIEIASLGSRVAGKLSGSLALGTTLQYSIYSGSKLFLVIFLPSLAYLVESGTTLNEYLLIVIISLFLTSLISLVVLLKFNFFQYYFQKVFYYYEVSNLPKALLKALIVSNNKSISCKNIEKFNMKKINNKKTNTSFLAYLFLVNGFFVSFLLTIIFPEYRLTLGQFVMVFHSFGALIVAFYLDPMLSRSLDRNDNDEIWSQNVYSIIYGRFLSYIFVFFIILIIFVICL